MGKLLVMGAALGCLSVTLTVAACLSYRSPFASSHDQQEAAGQVRQALSAPGTALHCTLHQVGRKCLGHKPCGAQALRSTSPVELKP